MAPWPPSLTLVPVDFERQQSWWHELQRAGFDANRPAVVASTGVSMYRTREANVATLRQLAQLARGSTVVMTFMQPIDAVYEEERAMAEMAHRGAARSGTPFVSLFRPSEVMALARECGEELLVAHIS